MDAQRESVIFNKRSMDNGTTEVPESFPRPGRIDIRKPNNKLSKQRLLEKQVRYGINQLEDITDGMNENRSPSSSRPVSSIASLSGYRKNSMYNRSNSNSASNSPVRVSNSVNNHFDMNMDDLSTPSTTAEMKKKRAKRRIPRNSTNNNGADVVTDSGLGSKGPLHQDVSVGFTTKEGAISSWVKLLANKNQPTGILENHYLLDIFSYFNFL